MKTSPARDADTLRFTLCDDQDMGDVAADPCWWSSDVVKPTMKPRPLFASAGSQRGWHQRDHLLRLRIPNLAELRRFLPRQADIAAQPKIENLPRLAALSLHHRTLPRSCPNIAPAVMKLVVVALG